MGGAAPGKGADRVPQLASSSTRENRRRASPVLLEEAVPQADASGCQVNRHRPIWLLHVRRPSEFTNRSGCRCIRTDPRRRMRPDSYLKPASEAYPKAYSSSIWLYIRPTARGARDSAFRIGVLHLVARRATTERLKSDSEKARKRGSNSRSGSGLDAATSSVFASIDFQRATWRAHPRPTCDWEGFAAHRPIRPDEYRPLRGTWFESIAAHHDSDLRQAR